MRKNLLHKVTALALSCVMLATVIPVSAAAENKSLGIYADGPVVTVEAPHTVDNVVTVQDVDGRTIERDYSQTIDVPLTNTSDSLVEYYMTVENPYSDLSMNFVGEGSSSRNPFTGELETQTATIAPGETVTARLMVFAQEAERDSYSGIRMVCHLVGMGTTEGTLSFSVTGGELSLESTVEERGSGVYQVTLKNTGPDVNSLKVDVDPASTELRSSLFFPEPINNYVLEENREVSFEVHCSKSILTAVSGNLVAKGNGDQVPIPITIEPYDLVGVSGDDLTDDPVREMEVTDVEVVPSGEGGNATVNYAMAYNDNGTEKKVPVSMGVTFTSEDHDFTSENPDDEIRVSVTGPDAGQITINIKRWTSLEKFNEILGIQPQAQTLSAEDGDEDAALFSTIDSTYDSVLAEFNIRIDASELDPEDLNDFANDFKDRKDRNESLDYVMNLPGLPDEIRDDYIARKQLVMIAEYIATLPPDHPLRKEFEDELRKFYGEDILDGKDPIEYLLDTEKKMLKDTEDLLVDNYSELKEILEKDEFNKGQGNKTVQDEVKDDEQKDKGSTMYINEKGHQCTNRGKISSQYVLPEVMEEIYGTSRASQSPADMGIEVYYAGRIQNDDPYVSFEPITYKLISNGQDAGISRNQGLSEMNLIEIPMDTVQFGSNSFTRDYDVNPGTHFVNTDNTFIISYPMHTKVQLADPSQLTLAAPDFDIYGKNIFATDEDGNYVKTAITGSNTLHVSISNRGSAGGFFTLSITDGNGNALRDEKITVNGEPRNRYYYLPAFYTQTLKLENVYLSAGSNTINVEITPVGPAGKNEINPDNNRATATLEARGRAVPSIGSLTATPDALNLGDTMRVNASVQSADDVSRTEFYLDDELLGVISGSKSNYSVAYRLPVDSAFAGTHEIKANVYYITGPTGSVQENSTPVQESLTINVIDPSANTPWAPVTLPAGLDAAAAEKMLLVYNAATEKYEEQPYELEISGDSLLLPGYYVNAEGTMLVLIQTDPATGKSKIYAGTIGAKNDGINLAEERTLSGVDFGEGLTVTIPGIPGSYQIGVEQDGTLKLPPMILQIQGFIGGTSETVSLLEEASRVDLTSPAGIQDIQNALGGAAVLADSGEAAETPAAQDDAAASAKLNLTWSALLGETGTIELTQGSVTTRGNVKNGEDSEAFIPGTYAVRVRIAGYAFDLGNITLRENRTETRQIGGIVQGRLSFDTTVYQNDGTLAYVSLHNLMDQNGNRLVESGAISGYVVFTPMGAGDPVVREVTVNNVNAPFNVNVPAVNGRYSTRFITSQDYYQVIATASSNGTITPSGSCVFAVGETASFVIKANDGYKISDVQVDGKSVGAVDSYEFTDAAAGSSHRISASFVVSGNQSGGGGGGGSSSSGYVVSVDSVSNGKISVSPRNAKKGATVTVTVTPDEGYVLDTLTVTTNSGKSVETSGTGKQYTFVMPGERVRVKAAFVQSDGKTDASVFTDVSSSSPFYDAINWAVENGVTNGLTATTFGPSNPCTRGQVVTFIWRANGSPDPSGTNNPFVDVSAESPFYKAILWAAENGITTGVTANTFAPGATITRSQAVTFMYRQAGSPEVSGSNDFTDVSASAYYANPVQWAVSKGITTGTTATTFAPSSPCTRGQIVTFLYRDANA